MFSRFHHRRGPSNSTPTSPTPPIHDSPTSWETAASHEQLKQQPHHQAAATSPRPPSSSSSNMDTIAPALASPSTPSSDMPPSLPPISRMSVLTVSPDLTYESLNNGSESDPPRSKASYSAPSSSLDTRRPPSQQMQMPTHFTPRLSSPPQSHERTHSQMQQPEQGFIGGMALSNLRRQDAQDLSAAAAAAATASASAAKRPSSSLTMATASPTSGPKSSPSTYSTSERRMSRSKPPPPPINTNLASRQYLSAQAAGGGQGRDPRSGSKSASSFVTPTDLQSSASAAAAAAASAANAANEMYNSNLTTTASIVNSSAATAAAAANARTKKSRPFLMKNPVSSLLGRRKTTASSPDMSGPSTRIVNDDGPVYAPIRGTRVHDFSAPRTNRVAANETPVSPSPAAAAAAAAIANSISMSKTPMSTSSSATRQPSVISPTPGQPKNTSRTPQIDASDNGSAAMSQITQQTASSSYATSRDSSVTPDATQINVALSPNPSAVEIHGDHTPMPSQNALQTLQENRTLLFHDKPLPERPTTEDSPRTSDVAERPGPSSTSSARTTSTSTRSRVVSADVSPVLKPSSSTRTTRSRNVSLSDLSPNSNSAGALPSTSATTPASVASALPKHMKSTSSRFSFMVGSASEEKVLEERHRQKQAEMKATHEDNNLFGDVTRDSRFDDFDEDDFDYDAMMDDDGLEEPIPGVNADADEEDDCHLYGHDDEEEIPYVGNDDEEEDVPETGLDDDDDAYDSHYEDAVSEHVVDKISTVQIEIEDDDPEGIDPNNDQENFAGFVFQRSNPASSLVSPISAGMAATPRDANGRVIGFAFSRDTTSDLPPQPATSLSPLGAHTGANLVMNMSLSMASNVDSGGLGPQQTSFQGEEYLEEQEDYDGLENMDQYGEEYDTENDTITAQKVTDASTQQLPGIDQVQADLDPQRQRHNDDLYFDQGLSDELDFGIPDVTAAPFDESIFDIEDTDQYGRPIPGAFAAAQAAQASQRAAMAAAIEAASGTAKRESDVPSPEVSEKSQMSESTAHTSTSVPGIPISAPLKVDDNDVISSSALPPSGFPSKQTLPTLSSQFAPTRKHEDSLTALRRQLPPILTDAERVAAYQAALSEAAFQAAASGKFRRDSSSTRFSPEPTSSPPARDLEDMRGTGLGLGLSLGLGGGESAVESSPVVANAASGLVDEESELPGAHSHLAYAFTSQRDLDYHHEFDDDDYTQDMDDYDFDDDAIIAEANAEALANDMDGFYGQEFNFYSAPVHQAASQKEAVEFANGGYFIPTGLGRSISGRVVSREPNLTPITERSEYSNRNSVMSLAVPPLGSSGELRSPGLAQLALLADDNNDMSLSALLRLRSKTFGGGSQASMSSSRDGSPMLYQGSVPSGDRERDRGDRENASSPFSGPTYSQLQLLQKQYPLPAHYQHHHRKNSATSFSGRGVASSEINSETGSDCGSPTLTNLATVANFVTDAPPMPLVPISPIHPAVSSGGSSCLPVMEEEGESLAAVERVPSDIIPTTGVSGRSSTSGSGLWMRSPVSGHSSVNKKQDRYYQDLELQLQIQQRENEAMQKKLQKLEQKQEVLEQTILASAPTSPASPGSPAPPIPAMSSRRTVSGHRHKGSADSISYVMTSDEGGESRWVMEHRRTDETGEVEIFKREVVNHI